MEQADVEGAKEMVCELVRELKEVFSGQMSMEEEVDTGLLRGQHVVAHQVWA